MRLLALLLCAGIAAGAPAPLAIVNAQVAQYEDGPPLPAGTPYIPGETVFLSFQVRGYQATPDQKVRLSYTIDAFDPRGTKLVETIQAKTEAELAPQDKDWKPKVRQTVLIPPIADSGTYRLVIQVKDEVSGATAGKELRFPVQGHQVDPSETLVMRNFGFYRGEDDRQPIAPPAYRPGDTVWARFDITGYKLGPGNQVDVDYGIAVLAPSGKVLFSKERADAEQSTSFYPKRYVPCIFNLSLEPNIRPGQYSIVLTARDHVGNQTTEEKETFSVE